MRSKKEGLAECTREGQQRTARKPPRRKVVIAGQEWGVGMGKEWVSGKEEGLSCQGRKIYNFIHTYLVSTNF